MLKAAFMQELEHMPDPFDIFDEPEYNDAMRAQNIIQAQIDELPEDTFDVTKDDLDAKKDELIEFIRNLDEKDVAKIAEEASEYADIFKSRTEEDALILEAISAEQKINGRDIEIPDRVDLESLRIPQEIKDQDDALSQFIQDEISKIKMPSDDVAQEESSEAKGGFVERLNASRKESAQEEGQSTATR